MDLKPAHIELQIEELVLHGFAPGDRYRIGEAVERELQRLFAEWRGAPSLTQGGEIAVLDGGGFDVAQGSKAETVGIQVARTLYGGLSR